MSSFFRFFGLDFDPQDKHYASFVKNLPSQQGKAIAITGTTSGTGYWAAVAAVRKNTSALFLVNRDSSRATECIKNLEIEKKAVGSQTEIIRINCDFMDFASVKAGAAELNKSAQRFGGLNIIGNNAGIMGFPDYRTKDGYDVQMQVNHLGQSLFSKLVMPSLMTKYKSGEEVRVVQHSSLARLRPERLERQYFEKSEASSLGGHDMMASFGRYWQTKLSNACFAMALAKKIDSNVNLDATRFKSVVAEPGISATSLSGNLFGSHRSLGYWHYMKVQAMGVAFMGSIIFKRKMQSAADGSLCLMQGLFGEDVDNGDFFIPEEKSVGLPFKEISKTVLVNNNLHDESLTLNEENQSLVWKVTEDEIGPYFS